MSPGGAEAAATLRCESSGCPYAVAMSKVGGKGEEARNQPLRQCQGPCGFFYHESCIEQVCVAVDC